MTSKKGLRVGYIRVSSLYQNTERQLAGIDLDRCYTDKITGIKSDRPQLNAMIEFVRDGDLVIVHSLDRLARDLFLLIEIVRKLNSKGVSIQFLKENITFNSVNKNPMDELVFHVFGAVAQFQRSILKEAQREGIEIAKKKGVYKGRKKSLNDDEEAQLLDILLKKNSNVAEYKKMKYAEIARKFDITPVTLWRYRKNLENTELNNEN
ncbi:recombinase family protein [Acinetobacter sp. ULE_I064]|uniref:recombinase family protein n=1 Tax=Acinetobacter sp. ULE_I064 TaxID=3373071 RepID=UPI003AFA0152